MIHPEFFDKIRNPPLEGDEEMDLLEECYNVIDELNGTDEVISFIDEVIKCESSVQVLFTIFLGINAGLDDGPLTLVSHGLTNHIGNRLDSKIQEAIIALKLHGIAQGVKLDSDDKDSLELLFSLGNTK